MKKTSVVFAVFLILILLLIPAYIAKESLNTKPSKQTERQHWFTGNTTRITPPIDLKVTRILYPGESPEAVVVVEAQRPELVLAALGLQQPIFVVDDLFLQQEYLQELERLAPKGLTQVTGTPQVVLLGERLQQYQEQMQSLGYRTISLPTSAEQDEFVQFARMVTQHSGESKSLIVGQGDWPFLLPTGSLLAHYGIPFLPITDSLSVTERDFLEEWSKQDQSRKIYYFGPTGSQIPDGLNEFGKVEQIVAKTPEDLAMRVVTYYDRENTFGWWGKETPEGGHNFILTNPNKEPQSVVAGLLASQDKFGPILMTEAQRLSLQVEKHYWELKPDFWMTPAEGPYNHTWVIGDELVVSYGVQGRVDFLQEIVPYDTFGAQGISGLEILFLLWIISGVLGAIWLTFHMWIRQPLISYLMKLAWILVVIITGPIGIWSYYQAYKGYDLQIAMGDWRRPLWVQALVSTVSSLAFGAATMIVIGFLLQVFGIPLLLLEGPVYVFGNSMLLVMVASYLGAFILNAFLFMPTMLRMGKQKSYGEAIREALPLVLISMTAVSIGMMGGMWWLMMEYLAMMPEESEILWVGLTYLATVWGLMVAYPANWLLVRSDRKKGRM